MAEVNRIFWMIAFLLGVIVFGWLEWQDSNSSQIAWFMLTSLWSAVCAIGYTVIDWFLVDKKNSP